MVLEDVAIVFGPDLLRCKAGKMDNAPEAICSPDKMMSGGCCQHAGVDAAEQHRQMWSNDVGQRVSHNALSEFGETAARESSAEHAHCLLREFAQILPWCAGPRTNGYGVHGRGSE